MRKPIDLIPAGKYLSGLAKTGKTAGLIAVKTSIQTAVKEDIEQGAKNFDTFKGLLKGKLHKMIFLLRKFQ